MQGNESPGASLLAWLIGGGGHGGSGVTGDIGGIVSTFATAPLSLQYLFTALFGVCIGSFLTVVIHRLPIMMERAWRADIEAEREALSDVASFDDPHEHEHKQSPGRGLADGQGDTAAPGWVPSPTRSTPTSTSTDAPPSAAAASDDVYNLSLPRSSCPHCGYQIRWRDNIPIVSYLLARGRCRRCGTPIGLLYPTVEILTMLLALAALWHFGPGWQGVAAFGLCAALIALAFIDAQTHLLPDSITLPLLWAGLLLNVGATFVPLADAVVGAAAGYLFLWAVYWGFRLLRGKEGMGYGDFKLLAALGAWFGWEALPQIILISALSGSVLGLLALARGRVKRDQPLPFGPYLAIAGVISLFAGDILQRWVAPALF